MRRTVFGIAVAASLVFCGPALAASYTFTLIAETGSTPGLSFGTLDRSPSINDSGTLAFLGGIHTTGDIGIYRDDGVSRTTVATNAPSWYYTGFTSPVITNDGSLGFHAGLGAGGAGVYSSDGTTTTTLVSIGQAGSLVLGLQGRAAFSNNGEVAFQGNPDFLHSAVFVADGSNPLVPNMFQEEGGVIAALSNRPAMNDSGVIAYMTLTNTGTRQLRIYDGVTDASVLEAINVGDPDINGSGTTAFYAELSGTEVGIYKRTAAGVVSNVAAATWGGFSSFDLPSINDGGTVAFYAGSSSVGAGIFTGGDASSDAVIKVGDALFGSIVDDLAFSHFGLNNDGQIAFWAHLQDGRQVEVRATLLQPPSVPGPGVLTLIGLGLAGIAVTRRRTSE